MRLSSSLFVPVACGAFLFCGAACSRTEAPAESAVVTVTRAEAQPVDETLAVSGGIEAVERVSVGFLVPGRVIRVAVQDGDAVQTGDTLAELDPADHEQQLKIAEARLAEVSARYERLKSLRELGSLTATDFEQIASALAQARSAAELARRQLDYTHLRAPFSGWVIRHGIEVGLVMAPGVPAYTILAPAPVWAVVGIPEADISKVRIGQAARVSLPSVGDRAFDGVVGVIQPQADPLSRSFAVKIRLPNSEGALRPGNVVTAQIQTGRTRSALLLPPQAIRHYPDGTLYVWTVEPPRGSAARRIVEAGPLQATRVEILSGLHPGDVVVVDCPATLFEGMPLRVASAP